MKQRLYNLVILIFLTGALLAQEKTNIESLLNRPLPDCNAIEHNARSLIPDYYYNGQMDSVMEVMTYWELRCEPSVDWSHLEILLGLAAGDYNAEHMPDLLEILLQYHEYQQRKIGYFYYQPEAVINARREYYEFLSILARDLLYDGGFSGLNRKVLQYYAGEYAELQEGLRERDFANEVPLQQEFWQRRQELIDAEEPFLGLYTGAWQPLDKLSRLGTHPLLGLQLGLYAKKMHFSLSGEYRFLPAPDEYRVFKDDSLFQTDRFSNYYFGLEVGRSLYRDLKQDLEVGVGLGVDGLNLIPSDEETGTEPLGLHSFNANIGLGYRHYIRYKNFIKVDLRYHFLNYRNGINSDFNGDALSVRFIFGITDNGPRQRQIEALGY